MTNVEHQIKIPWITILMPKADDLNSERSSMRCRAEFINDETAKRMYSVLRTVDDKVRQRPYHLHRFFLCPNRRKQAASGLSGVRASSLGKSCLQCLI